jgi:hypothetical protein
MTPMQGRPQQPPADINHYQNTMMNLVYNVCSIVTLPLEMLLRPQYGTRYCPPTIQFFTSVMMTLLPVLSGMADSFSHMLPFMGFTRLTGMFGIGTLSKLYFAGSFIQGFRIWRLMMSPQREKISHYEGAALPIFRVLPGSFFTVRIIYEPLFVLVMTLVLQNFFILQDSAVHYLVIAAVMLAMKEYVAWFKSWEALRDIMDAANTGPIIAKIVDNTATDDEYAQIHVASLPKDLSNEFRQSTADRLKRIFSDDERKLP